MMNGWKQWASALALVAGFSGCGDDGGGGSTDADSGANTDGVVGDVSDAMDDSSDSGGLPDANTQDTRPPDVSEDAGPDVPDSTADVDAGPTFDWGVCEGSADGDTPLGGACCYTTASHPNNPSCLWYEANFGDGECLDDQCADGLCTSARYCSKLCQLGPDNKNNATGSAGSDGVTDEDQYNDCVDAVDGPVGAAFRCINQTDSFDQQTGVCRPGTTFAACEANQDCAEGESCQLVFIAGSTQSRCMTSPKDALPMVAACNSDPATGPTTACAGAFCFGVGCVDLCASDANCATDVCEGGFCSKNSERSCESNADCSAWSCQEVVPYSNSDYTDDFCLPRSCRLAGDCQDPDYFCRPFWNGAETVEEVAFEPACRRKEQGTAAYGEACGFEGDGSGLPECAYAPSCFDGYCAPPCRTDGDCADGTECLLGFEWNLDVDDDEEVDTYLNVDVCRPWGHEGELTDCLSDEDCPAEHHCEYRVKGAGEGAERVWEVEYKCKSNEGTQLEFGQTCAEEEGTECPSNLCLISNADPDAGAMCTETCGSATDCPDFVEWGGVTWKTLCLSFQVNAGQSLDPVDDSFVPYCWRTSSVGSREPCDEERQCASPNEYCRATGIATNPDQPVTVEHWCLDASEGLDAIPELEVGQPCEAWTECKSRACYPDGDGGGYCAALCDTDAACQSENGIANLKCTDVEFFPRPNPENSGWTRRCILQKSCIPCGSDGDCGGNYVCANFGGLGALADFRCAAPCKKSEDCLLTGGICKSLVDATGTPLDQKACVVANCE